MSSVMWLDQESLRFIFGLKLRTLRQEKGLSLKVLSRASGLSPSYLNEIEKGKKYPKTEKILQLADSLDVSYDDLISLKLDSELDQLSNVLKNNSIKGLPFDVFGLPAQTIFELIADSPQEISALIGTTLELARNFGVEVDDFFFATLRAYIDMNGNYFADLENSATSYAQTLGLPDAAMERKRVLTPQFLGDRLLKEYGYRIIEKPFAEFGPEMHDLYFFSDMKTKNPRFFLNASLSADEKTFILARELGRNVLGIKEWVPYSLNSGFVSYNQLLNYFRSSYFASALLMPEQSVIESGRSLLEASNWDPDRFVELVNGFAGTPKSFVHRLTQILPKHLGFEKLFYFRAQYDVKDDSFQLIKETHLSDLHTPHRINSVQHYCRRWITHSLIKEQRKTSGQTLAGAQVSSFYGTKDSFLCFSLAYPSSLQPSRSEILTVGIRLDEATEKRIPLLQDERIPRKVVSQTCETCEIEDCESRVAPPTLVSAQTRNERISQKIREITSI